MKITKVMVAMGKTINVGNYESVRVDYSMEAQVGEHEDSKLCIRNLEDAVRNFVIEEAVNIKEEHAR